MRILLLGEYSNVHNTLAEGLRALGHSVIVASNGDYWKNYPRDIDLQREMSTCGSISFLGRLLKALPKMRGFDVVQIINPIFLELKAEHLLPIYKYLRRNNKKVFLGAFGMDYYWAQVNTDIRPMRYSDFNIGDTIRHDEPAELDRKDWIGTSKEKLNRYIAHDCCGIITGLYEYQITYENAENGRFCKKLKHIPFPIKCVDSSFHKFDGQRIKVFIGISKGRSVYKGTDIMLAAAKELQDKYPEKMELFIANGIPFAEYQRMMTGSDIILDQLYGYAPAMNALLAMSKGIIAVGGGEPEVYSLLNEDKLHPLINVEPNKDSVYSTLEDLILHPERIPDLQQQSREYVIRHHDYIKVAQQYIDFWSLFL